MPPRAAQGNNAALDFSFSRLLQYATGRAGFSAGGGNRPRYRASTPGQSYFSVTLLKTPFGNLRLSKRFSVWTGFVTLLLGVLTFLARQANLLGRDFEDAFDRYLVRPVQQFVGDRIGKTNKNAEDEFGGGLSDEGRDFPFPRDDYVYGLRVVRDYPREESSFTQGFLMLDEEAHLAASVGGTRTGASENNLLAYYESTGLYGESRVQKMLLGGESGNGHAKQSGSQYSNADHEFGEGLAFHKGYFWQLVWRNATIHQLSPDLTTRIASFGTKFQHQDGWGLTSDDEFLYATDSGDRIYTLKLKYGDAADPPRAETGEKAPPIVGVETVNEQVVRGKYNRKIPMVNELEYIAEGEVWGNVFGKDCIARINPKTGKVFGWLLGINLRREWRGVLGSRAEVFNGIAVYWGKEGRTGESRPRVFVTGKLWARVFEVELVPMPKQPSYNELKSLCLPEKNIFREV